MMATRHSIVALAGLAAAVLLASCAAARGQTLSAEPRSARGRIEGLATVERPRPDSVAYGKVTLSPGSIETRTDSMGRFALDSVPPGLYRLEISAFLYKPYGTEIEVTAARTTVIHVVLELDEGAYQHYRFNAAHPSHEPAPTPPPR